jgi:hypothetical protein
MCKLENDRNLKFRLAAWSSKATYPQRPADAARDSQQYIVPARERQRLHNEKAPRMPLITLP